VAWGFETNIYDFKEKYGKAMYKHGITSMVINAVTCDEDQFLDDFNEYGREVLESAGLETASIEYGDDLMVGVSPVKMKDSQTLIEFKRDICSKFAKIGIEVKPEELEWVEEGWYAG